MVDKKEKKGIWLGRRDFLTKMGWGGFLLSVGGSLLGVLRYFFPRVLFEPSPVFKAGFPDEYPVNTVSDRWKKDYRVWIIRTEAGFYALSAICTHLGCTPIWLNAEDKFKCPCHGSGFRRSGKNYEGPAPRPLERFKIILAEDGQIIVDRSNKFLSEKGEWDKPEAFLSYTT
ncbi:ubiquinol-cytochrome c reductase iron-sulfur subunit [candidate division TA06 bacterium]|nr:ubiquinol-cytochrome c reductase iron-sulfur subunit [candidate division TA06 bacterium]